MWRLIISLLITVPLNAQVFRPDKGLERHITQSTIYVGDVLFKGPSFQDPIILIKYSPLFPGVIGVTRELSSGWFLVDLNPIYSDWQLERTLIHELKHVFQIYSGRLSVDAGFFIWENRKYPFSTSYKTRPWEIDAENTVKLYCD